MEDKDSTTADDLVTSAGQDGDQKRRAIFESKQLLKWQVMIEDWQWFISNQPDKVRFYVRMGIPDCMRGTVWQMMAGSVELQVSNKGCYQDLLRRPANSLDSDIIRDISRTFPKHICFRERHGLGQRSLFNVLKAYCDYHPIVGYCQGMGFICALLLVYMDEESTFWLLHRLITDYGMEGLYKEGLPDVARHFYVLERLLQIYTPNLYDHMKSENMDPTMYASQWFMTLFSCNFPFNTVLRIWDIYFAEGMIIVYRVSLALLKKAEADLLSLSLEEMLEYLKVVPKSVRDDDSLIRDALAIDLTDQKLSQINKEFTDDPAVRAALQPGDFAFSKPSWLPT